MHGICVWPWGVLWGYGMRWLAVWMAMWWVPSAWALVVGVYELSPHVIVEERKEPAGAVVDFVNEVVVRHGGMGAIEWRVANFARCLRELENGQMDMVFLVAKNPQREKLFRYASTPLFLTRSAVVVRKSHPLSRVGAMEQLRGLTLGHAHASIIPAYFDGLDIRFQSIAGDDYFNRGLKMLELGRHDAYYAPTVSNAQYLVKRMGGTQQFNVLELPGDALGLYVVFSKTMDENMYSRMDTLLRDNVARYRDLLGPYIR